MAYLCQSLTSRAPPVLREEGGVVVNQERPEVEVVEDQDLLDNLFFTFCCGDNLTCLKANMVRSNLLCSILFSFLLPRCAMVCSTVLKAKMSPSVRRSKWISKKSLARRKTKSFPKN